MMNHRNAGIRNETSGFYVAGSCGMCKERIEKAALSVKGVKFARWDPDKQDISVDYDKGITAQEAIQEAIAKAGHDTELFKADYVTYMSLPKCCHYRK